MSSPLLHRIMSALADDEFEISDKGTGDTTSDPTFEYARACHFANCGARIMLGLVMDAALVKARGSKHAIEEARAEIAAIEPITDRQSAAAAVPFLEYIVHQSSRVGGLAVLETVASSALKLAIAVAEGTPSPRLSNEVAKHYGNIAYLSVERLPLEMEKRAIIGIIQECIDGAIRLETGEVSNISPTLEIFARDLGIQVPLTGTGSLSSRENYRARVLADLCLHRLAPLIMRQHQLMPTERVALERAAGQIDPSTLAISEQAVETAAHTLMEDKGSAAADTLLAAAAAASALRGNLDARYRAAARNAALCAKYAISAGIDEFLVDELATDALALAIVGKD